MDGYEATRQIRYWEDKLHDEMPHDLSRQRNRIPIIALTAHAITGYRDSCIEAGMDDYLSKPLRREELSSMVDSWIRKVNSKEEEQAGERQHLEAEERNDEPLENIQCPIDLKKAMIEFDSDMDFVKETLRGFLRNVQRQIEIIRTAIKEKNAEVTRQEAHSIKGGAANICADDLSHVAMEMETLAKTGNVDNGQEILVRLENEFNRLKGYNDTQQ
jgi:CheY-like chemotaxis protein